MTWALYAEFTANPGSEERVTELVRALAEQVRAEPGNLVFNPHTLVDEPRRWFVYEEYRDEAAFHEHLAALYERQRPRRPGWSGRWRAVRRSRTR